jgi:hypothetical protein
MSSSLRSNKREGGGSIQYRLVAERMTKGRVGVSSWDWLHGAQVSKARPGAPFYCYRRSELTLPRLLLGVADCHPNRRSQGPAANPKVMKRLGPATTLYRTLALSFVIPSEAEGSAVPLDPKPMSRAKKKPLFPGASSLNSNPGNQATLRINLSRSSSGIRSCNTRAWAIATSAI